MRTMLLNSLSSAMVRLQQHADLVMLHNIDESTFRSFVMAELVLLARDVRLQTEWKNRVDLLVQRGDENAIIEFKFNLTRPLLSLDGKHRQWKGGAGPKNEREFQKCIEKVRALQLDDIQHRFVVLAYETSTNRDSKHSFTGSYSNLESFGDFKTFDVEHSYPAMACRLIEVS